MLLAVLCVGGGIFLVTQSKNAADTKQQNESSARLLVVDIDGIIAPYKTGAR